ncbi:hypothetical protein KRMM14A1259_62630 [Krasilnikovia sp. MM14-A1259]
MPRHEADFRETLDEQLVNDKIPGPHSRRGKAPSPAPEPCSRPSRARGAAGIDGPPDDPERVAVREAVHRCGSSPADVASGS